jgi:hypothetical protein
MLSRARLDWSPTSPLVTNLEQRLVTKKGFHNQRGHQRHQRHQPFHKLRVEMGIRTEHQFPYENMF